MYRPVCMLNENFKLTSKNDAPLFIKISKHFRITEAKVPDGITTILEYLT